MQNLQSDSSYLEMQLIAKKKCRFLHQYDVQIILKEKKIHKKITCQVLGLPWWTCTLHHEAHLLE